MYQAITTRFVAPTNTRGAKIVAECAAKTMRFSYYELELAIHQLPMTVNKWTFI